MNTQQNLTGKIQGPAWDLSTEYPSFDSDLYKKDFAELEENIPKLATLSAKIGKNVEIAASLDTANNKEIIDSIVKFLALNEKISILFQSMLTYTSCRLSTNGSDEDAQKQRGKLQALHAKFNAACSGTELFIVLASDKFFEQLCKVPEVQPYIFYFSEERKRKNRMLPLAAEELTQSMSADGYTAWGTLYNTITGTIKCHIKSVDGKDIDVGLAEAASYLKRPERNLREAAWYGINKALAMHKESFAAILNSISGWRLTQNRLRSHTEKIHFLDGALSQSRMKKETLDTMIGVIKANRELGRRALLAQAKLYNVEKLGPWDILAPAPVSGNKAKAIPFEEGLAIVRRAYATIDPSMGEFVDMMAKNHRIEGRVMDGKRPGAYCTEFGKSRNPFVYTTYQGALSELSTLAHELGHAYHCKVMEDMPIVQADYPMTLAETASTFAETVLADMLAKEAKDPDTVLDLAWADANDAATFLVNIPARFAFESNFYEQRANGPLNPDAFCKTMNDAWKEWYGEALSEYDNWYWASKLHFHKTEIQFYNFPYCFGYLFSLGVYAKKEELGDKFHSAYVALLRDSGRMTVEDVAQKHLGVDLTKPDFWEGSIRIITEKLERFEKIVASKCAK